ncbi:MULTISPECIES: SLC13 family permease [Brevibacterium]|mgnify:CR=1 FL=1|uniref:Dicarboxylate carrier MatC domain-containing protein n=2 Tax=Brevibacterium casei TaxID=33889 RepID=K9AND4_9MICO|nr:SLC13 family permease [Brevibacterium casei]SIH88264.1 dicarboxylate carrier MatC domain-containing protein [Mycobacteroides abscessus subsp. abscessus]EKU48819.1 dicarboxylate carrier MatC domain-containing protein [Brevibacterium casei S18]KZE23438.1 C4-dicarboxylate ABC transporter [Brevibacterium casei]MCT1766012.1 SLC13 family permease [Brevibacterium casei]MCT2182366.1 SLC13 family permease [Brevibacterium casei]
MLAQLIALGVFIALFAIGAVRGVHIGVLMLVGAAGTGLLLTDMTVEDIIAGFPLSIMVLLAGVTYFFAIAQENGTVDRIIDWALEKVGSSAVLLPLVFFVITAGIASMGAPLAGLVMMPVGMQVARKYGVDYALMGLAICFAIGAGGFAPTSLYGIVTYSTADDAGIGLSPFLLFGIAVIVYLLMLTVAYLMFGRRLFAGRKTAAVSSRGGGAADSNSTAASAAAEPRISRGGASATKVAFGEDDEDEALFDAGAASADSGTRPFTGVQILTVVLMVGLIGSVVVLAALGQEPDIGLLCFLFGAILALVDPATGKAALPKIDWSTVLLVGGIITFVGVLQEMGAVDLLGDGAKAIGSPLLAAFVLCVVGGLVSAFASTTGILAALVPLALPLIEAGGVPGWALIAALGICSAVVDVSPFSTLGATVVATAPGEEKPRLTRILVKFGMSMVIIGPIVLVGGLVLPAMLF